MLKKIIREYFDLEDGVFIDKYSELIQVNKAYNIFISRRSLKHFVERRKGDFKKYSKSEILDKLYFAIEHITDTITDSDLVELHTLKTVFVKKFFIDEYVYLRVIVEFKSTGFEIKSIHFRR